MGRQMLLGGSIPAGSGCVAQADPLALPVRFMAEDARADGHVRHIEIDQSRVLLRRRVQGMAMRLALPLNMYRGVALRSAPGEDMPILSLEHADPALSVPLACEIGGDVAAQSQRWSRMLGLPLLVEGGECDLREANPRSDTTEDRRAAPRRRRSNAIKRRRPTLPLRRRTGATREIIEIYREREIIGRD